MSPRCSIRQSKRLNSQLVTYDEFRRNSDCKTDGLMTRRLSFRTVTEAGPSEETEKDSLDRELDLIRARREGDKRFFRGAFEDYTLLTGIIIGAVFFGGVFVMSSGWVASDSIVIDKTLSATPLDPGGECVDKRGEVWFNVFYDVDGHVIKVISHNVDPGAQTVIGIVIVISEAESITLLQGGFGDQELEYDPDDLENGHYNASASIWQVTTESNLEDMSQDELQLWWTLPESTQKSNHSKQKILLMQKLSMMNPAPVGRFKGQVIGAG